jgi:hypothetical protein
VLLGVVVIEMGPLIAPHMLQSIKTCDDYDADVPDVVPRLSAPSATRRLRLGGLF